MQNQTIAVIGGTGKSGKYLVKELLKRGCSIRLLLRHPENFNKAHPGIPVVQGDARHYEDVLRLLQGCTAVISTLGQPKGESSIFSAATSNVLKAMKTTGIRRYIVTTGLSVNAPGDCKSASIRQATDWMYANYPETTVDKQREYELLLASQVDWTMVRLPLIDLTEEEVPVHVSLEDCPGDKISAASLAVFLPEQLNSAEFVGKAPFIANQ